jgi:hypothetical protein
VHDDLNLKNYQRHGYQKSWRVARGGDCHSDASGRAHGNRNSAEFHSRGEFELKNYQRHAIRNS